MILFEKEVIDFLDNLIFDLYIENYFSYTENAEDYVIKIIDFINESIENFPAKNTPNKLYLYGSKYIFYKSNQRTTWFIFFEQKKQTILITHIFNNHCKEANLLLDE